jgi:hypothetical protein
MAYSLRIVRALAIAAFLAPIAATAQQPVSTDPISNPSQHLADAGKQLDSIPNKVAGDAKEPLADLRKHFAELDKAYRAQGNGIGQPILAEGAATPVSQADLAKQEAPLVWQDVFSVVERDLALLIGGGAITEATPSIPPTAPAAPARPAAGTPDPTTAPPATPPQVAPGLAENPTPLADMVISNKVNERGLKDLDPATHTALDQFRVQLELFYASTMGGWRAGLTQ